MTSAWTERCQTVRTWIEFVGDFGQIDVTSLLAQIDQADLDSAAIFVETIEALLKIGNLPCQPWAAFEHVRDYCVVALQVRGEKPGRQVNVSRRMTPFSVPMELLRTVFAPTTWSNHEFQPNRLRSRNEGFIFDLPNGCLEHRFYLPQDQITLFTTIWARAVPAVEPLRHRVEIIDESANRFQKMLLWTLVAEPQPLFMPLLPNSSLQITIRAEPAHAGERSPAHVLMSMEGWTYLL